MELLEVEQRWEMAATSLHNDVLLNSEECHKRAANCAYANDDPLVELCELHRLRNGNTNIGLNGRNGGAERTVWEILLEMERFNYHAGEGDPAEALVLDLANAFERLGRRKSIFQRKIFAGAVRAFRASVACSV